MQTHPCERSCSQPIIRNKEEDKSQVAAQWACTQSNALLYLSGGRWSCSLCVKGGRGEEEGPGNTTLVPRGSSQAHWALQARSELTPPVSGPTFTLHLPFADNRKPNLVHTSALLLGKSFALISQRSVAIFNDTKTCILSLFWFLSNNNQQILSDTASKYSMLSFWKAIFRREQFLSIRHIIHDLK